MTIAIKQDDIGIKFYNESESEPSAIIYNGSNVAIINEGFLSTMGDATQLSQLMSLVGVFVQSLQAKGGAIKKKAFDVVYVNELMPEKKSARYSPRNVLYRMYSDKIVSVDMKKRIRFQFISFGFEDGKVIINYKPVIW